MRALDAKALRWKRLVQSVAFAESHRQPFVVVIRRLACAVSLFARLVAVGVTARLELHE